MPKIIEYTSASAVQGQCRLRDTICRDSMANSISASIVLTATAARPGHDRPCLPAPSNRTSPNIAALPTGNQRRCTISSWNCPFHDADALHKARMLSGGLMEKSIEAETHRTIAHGASDGKKGHASGHRARTIRKPASVSAPTMPQIHDREASAVAAGSQTALHPSSACKTILSGNPNLSAIADAIADTHAVVIKPPFSRLARECYAAARIATTCKFLQSAPRNADVGLADCLCRPDGSPATGRFNPSYLPHCSLLIAH